MSIHFDLPKETDSIIKVIGVGGGGSNAVNHMYAKGIVGVNFVVCNTDKQALAQSAVPQQIQLGPGLTDGRGAGSQPEIGKNASIESIDDIKQALGGNTKMIFITAGMGGGTGTGGAPIVAKAARELGILTVGIVTVPFTFEGRKRIMQAQKGIEEMKENVDTLIIISNDKLRGLYGNLALSDAFARADDILATAAKGIAEIITVPGYVNVDFEDVNTVMRDSGVAIMGTGVADGEDRAMKAVKAALASPLLSDNDIRGAKHILLNITSGTKEVLMDEVGDITNYIQDTAGYTSEVIWGNCIEESLGEKLSVTVIATGFESNQEHEADEVIEKKKERFSLEDKPAYKTRNNREKEQPSRRYQNPYGDYNQRTPKEEPVKKVRFRLDEEEPDRYHRPKNKVEDTYKEKKRKVYNLEQEEEQRRVIQERRKRLRGLNMKINNLSELEQEPAYKRRNINLEDVPHSSEPNISKYSLIEEEKHKPEIKKRNPFLHNNVD